MKKYLLALWFASSAVGAQQVEISTKPLARALEYAFTLSASGKEPCGVELHFGDGKSVKREIKPGTPLVVEHRYPERGLYAAQAVGRDLPGFFVPTVACRTDRAVVAWIVDQKVLDEGGLDVLILARTPARRRDGPFATHIDGSLRLADPRGKACGNVALVDDIRRNARRESRVFDEITEAGALPLLSVGALYRQLGVDKLPEVAAARIDEELKKLGAEPNQPICRIRQGADEAAYSELVALPRALLPAFAQLPRFAELPQYQVLSILPLAEAREQSAQLREKQDAAGKLLAAVNEELETLAASASKEKVGALILNEARMMGQRKIEFCTTAYKGEEAAAISGHRLLEADILLPDMKERLSRERGLFAVGDGKPFDKVFDGVNQAFIALSKSPHECVVFIDYPANLLALKKALSRERAANVALGVLSEAGAARDRSAKRRGFDNWADNQFAVSIGANPAQLKTLKAPGLGGQAELDAALTEMQKSGYATGRDLGNLLAYLRDRDEARTRKIGAIEVRDQRLEEARKARARDELERQKRREEYAKEYPFEAVIACGFQGRHTNIVACFGGGRNSPGTEIELRNGGQGGDYGLYRAWEIARLGREEPGVGLIIPLRRTFELKAQNADENLTLTVKIRETASGREVFVKSAAQYGVVSVKW